MTIYYWTGISGNKDLIETYRNDLRSILGRDYATSNLEKLKTGISKYPVYSFRLNHKERLLFTTYKNQLHVLEVLLDHNYKTSKFLKHHISERELENNGKMHESLFDVIHEKDRPTFSESTEEVFVGLDHYNGRLMQLSANQESIVHFDSTHFPLLLLGTQGMGKTYIGLSLLRQQVDTERSGKYLYVTQQAKLVERMRQNWEEGFYSTEAENNVYFRTYDELFPAFKPDAFSSWFKNLKADKQWEGLSKDVIYREFRICSGFSKEDYCSLGVRQSCIDPERRTDFYETMFELFLRVTEHSEFHSEEVDAQYQFIVIDEAHNFTPAQLYHLTKLAENHQVGLCMDPLQNIHDTCSLRTIVEQSFRLKQIPLQEAVLTECYRNTKQVIDVLNQLLCITRVVQNGISDKKEILNLTAQEDAAEGECHIMTLSSASTALATRAQTTELAVVTDSAYLEEASSRFNTPLVFTPEEIMGQEFHSIVVYRLFETGEMKKLLKEQRRKFPDEKLPSNIPNHLSNDRSSYYFSPELKQLYVAMSRATHALFIANERDNYLLNILREKIKRQTVQLVELQRDWASMAETQSKLGNTRVAEQILAQMNPPAPEVLVKGSLETSRREEMENVSSLRFFKDSSKKPLSSKQSLCASIPTPTTFDKKKSLAFIEACENENMKLINQSLADPAVNVNHRNKKGNTGLLAAVACGRHTVVLRLLNVPKIDLNLKTIPDDYSALSLAALAGRDNIVRLILDRLSSLPKSDQRSVINYQDRNGTTALILAAAGRHVKVVELLLSQNCIDINLQSIQGMNAVMAAIIQNGQDWTDNSNVLEGLLNHKQNGKYSANLNVQSGDGQTVFHYACIYPDSGMLRVLLKKKARLNLNAPDLKGRTGLMHLVSRKAIDSTHITDEEAKKSLELLLKQLDLDVNQICNEGYSALMYALIHGQKEMIDVLTQEDRIDVLYRHAAIGNVLDMALEDEKTHGNVVQSLLKNKRLFDYASELALTVKGKSAPFLQKLISNLYAFDVDWINSSSASAVPLLDSFLR